LILKGADFVLGVETNSQSREKAQALIKTLQLDSQTAFQKYLSETDLGKFDIIISQHSMEHFPDPEKIFDIMISALHPRGELLISLGPPWFAPYGSHMQFFTPIPWVQLLFSEGTVMNVRKRFRDDGAKKYQDVESGLNKMSVKKFEKLIHKKKLKIKYQRYGCVKKLTPLGCVPWARELFINQVNCILIKP
ncbi:MAG: class I SAM-dependent methyltransferase, partial [Candidatus Omnitrophica bacterium]|nr:class I SAM-dependent methyltransferase [Candidatus Omnitrophota bacterium]